VPSCWQYTVSDGTVSRDWAHHVAAITDGTGDILLLGEASRLLKDPELYFNYWNRVAWVNSVVGLIGTTSTMGFAMTTFRFNARLQVPDPPAVTPGTAWLVAGATGDATQAGRFGFWSQHPGGPSFLLGDGPVRFLKNPIAPPIYRGLSIGTGGEVISADSY
jgi:hypothetical protein